MKSHKAIPASVSLAARQVYAASYERMTFGTERLFLFAGDQKIEHLNKDFFGPGIAADASDPEHLFRIASQARIGCFAAQLGLIARYALQYPTIPYLVKMNAKTDLIPLEQRDPVSKQLVQIDDVLRMRDDHRLSILGVGYTIYLGSEYESEMLVEASRLIMQAHKEGLLVVLWMYPRGKAVGAERSHEIIAGAAGVAHSLGADFVKVNPPQAASLNEQLEFLRQASRAAGNTGVICSGGASRDPEIFLHELRLQIKQGGVSGAAIGRNIHQKNLADAVNFCNAVASIIYDNVVG